MQPLPANASLRDSQGYVRKLEVERGFAARPAGAQCLKMVEEVGEVTRAVGTLEGRPGDPEGRIADLGGEAVDVLLIARHWR